MRKISRKAFVAVAVIAGVQIFSSLAEAQSGESVNYNTTNNNLSGFSLPGVQLPQGSDEVRAADGTSCRAAVSGNGAYVDLGVMGNPDSSASQSSASVYGRMVIPLNAPRKRVDCTQLYNLEIERLKVELQLLKMGIGRDPIATSSTSGNGGEQSAGWANEGWSTHGRKKDN
jgi:hypothetical protein